MFPSSMDRKISHDKDARLSSGVCLEHPYFEGGEALTRRARTLELPISFLVFVLVLRYDLATNLPPTVLLPLVAPPTFAPGSTRSAPRTAPASPPTTGTTPRSTARSAGVGRPLISGTGRARATTRALGRPRRPAAASTRSTSTSWGRSTRPPRTTTWDASRTTLKTACSRT